jgi:hypothetical protein
MRAIRKIVMIGAAVATVTTVAVSSAFADPSSTPPLKSYVGVGSAGDAPVFDVLSTSYNSVSTHTTKLYSWDAVNPTTGQVGDTITTKASSSTDTTCNIARPDGSSAGITALENTATDGGFHCIDFARSARGPATTDPNTIAFVALAKDAITWVSPKGVTGTASPAPKSLTLTQLANIYACTSGFTTWADVGGKTSATIVPVLPQSGSGSRSAFLLAMGQVLGLGSGVSLTPGSCVVNGTDSAGAIQENTGVTAPNQEVFGTKTAPLVNAMFIYSVADYIAQTAEGHSSSIWQPAELGLHSVTDTGGTARFPTSGTGTTEHINPSFPAQLWITIYDVVPNAGTESAPAIPTTPVNLQKVFDANSGTTKGWLCQSTALTDLKSYGFTGLGTNCGSITDEFLTYG